MTVSSITQILEELAPLDHAEDFDNVGLLVGDNSMKVEGILVTLDTIECVIDEAIAHNCNLIVSFHPIIFGGLKKLIGRNYVERTVLKAIKNDIAIYAIHTALDNVHQGVNGKICEVLGLKKTKILIPKKDTIRKLTTYVPSANSNNLKEKLFEAGAGNIGNYSNCSFTVEGTGSYKPGENSNPTLGKIGETHFEKETLVSVTYLKSHERNVLKSLVENHPYEEVAYEVYSLENSNQDIGMGMLGELEEAMSENQFLKHLKSVMNAQVVRHSELRGKPVKKVAVLGGSGAFAIGTAKASGADVFVTADVKYHQFYEAENKMVIADIGHFETEQFTKNLLVDYLTKKIPNFAIRLSESITNPIKYF